MLCSALGAAGLRRTSTPTPGAGTSASQTWARAHESSAPVLSRACSVVMERSASVSVGGASDGARTHDLLITNQGLYQLSYTGLSVDPGGFP